jgi:hypothetical protein
MHNNKKAGLHPAFGLLIAASAAKQTPVPEQTKEYKNKEQYGAIASKTGLCSQDVIHNGTSFREKSIHQPRQQGDMLEQPPLSQKSSRKRMMNIRTSQLSPKPLKNPI